MLSYLILFYLILSYLILSDLNLSYLILSDLILSYLILSYRFFSSPALSDAVLSCIVHTLLSILHSILCLDNKFSFHVSVDDCLHNSIPRHSISSIFFNL